MKMKRLWDRKENRLELVVLFITVFIQVMGLLSFLFVTEGGWVVYPAWKTVDRVLYYTSAIYQSRELLIVGVLVVILIEASIVFYGICKRTYMAGFGCSASMLLYMGLFIQVFYNAGANLKRHIIFALFGFVAMWLYYFFIRTKLNAPKAKLLINIIFILIGINILSVVIGILFKININGSYGWIVIGGISIQPGEILKALLILLAAFIFRIRIERKLTFLYLGTSLLSVAVLVLSRDLGNAVIVLVISIVAAFFLFDQWYYILGFCGLCAIGVFATSRIPYVGKRFAACFHALESGAGQHYNSLLAILKYGLNGCSPGGEVVAATSVTSSSTDFVFNVLIAIYGVGMGVLLVGFLLCVVFQMVITPIHSPFHYLLGVLSVTTLSLHQAISIAGNLNVVPLSGLCINFLSQGGSNMLTSFLLLGGIMASLSPGYEKKEEERKGVGVWLKRLRLNESL